MNKTLLYLAIIAVASSIVAGAFYYAKHTGKAECVAEYAEKEKINAEAETKRWINRPRNRSELIDRLRERAAAKRKASLQRGS